MAEVLEGFEEHALHAVPPVAPTEVDEVAIRRLLREQVARLEGELGALFCSTYPRTGFEWNVGSRGGPRGLSLSEVEGGGDQLAAKPPDQHTPPRPPHAPPPTPPPAQRGLAGAGCVVEKRVLSAKEKEKKLRPR